MILSAAIVDKDGIVHVARQYTEMTKAKVEAFYMAFSRLITKGKQHTMIETQEVRYVYRAINEFYCVLITDKHSNILEDIKTLSLFVGAITEYISVGKGIHMDSLTDCRFDLLFLFDELVSMGVRQVENIYQVKTIMAMESEQERLETANRLKKEREAKATAAEKSKQLDRQRRNEALAAYERIQMDQYTNRSSYNDSSMSSLSKSSQPVAEKIDSEPAKPARVMSRGRALKLKPKN